MAELVANYVFGDDEYVVLKTNKVALDKGSSSKRTKDELILTNKNILLAKKGFTGKVKGYYVYPLSDIRVVDGKPHCKLNTSEFMVVKLEIGLKNDLVLFVFDWMEGEQHIREWIDQLYVMFTGHEAPREALRGGKKHDFFEEEDIADVVGRVAGTFTNAFKRKRSEAAPEVSRKCPSCNASVSGRQGTTIECPYCGSHVTFS